MPKTPFNPRTGKYLPLSDDRAIGQFEMIEEEASRLKCTDMQTGATVYVAKPYMLREDLFHEQTVDGVSYSFTAIGQRTASAPGEDDEEQLITPDYLVGETIFAFRGHVAILLPDDVTMFHGEWTDLNACGRCWAVEVSE
jgi:hypothetical protein